MSEGESLITIYKKILASFFAWKMSHLGILLVLLETRAFSDQSTMPHTFII